MIAPIMTLTNKAPEVEVTPKNNGLFTMLPGLQSIKFVTTTLVTFGTQVPLLSTT